MEIALITMLGAAVGITISLLGAAVFSALSRIDGLQHDIGLLRATLVEGFASLRAEIVSVDQRLRTELRASHDDLAARLDQHIRQHVA
jgi:hypothetical protein